jgi:hypothetical protein
LNKEILQMGTCHRCGAAIDTDLDQVCPRCGAPFITDRPEGKELGPDAAGSRVYVSLLIFGTALLAFFALTAWSRWDIARTAETAPEPMQTVTDETFAEPDVLDISLDTGRLVVAVKEFIDREPGQPDALTSLVQESFDREPTGFDVIFTSDTATLRDRAADLEAATYISCEARLTSRVETTADGSDRYYVSATVNLRARLTSTDAIVFARKKAAGATGNTPEEAIDAARRKTVEPLIEEVSESIRRVYPPVEKPATDDPEI